MIKFVYFDVGGVMIKDFSASNKWKELQSTIGVTPENEERFLEIWMKYRNRICINYDVDDMISEFTTKVGLTFPKNFSFLQEFIDRFEKNELIWPVIGKIKKSVKIGLLTNMYPRMLSSIEKAFLLPSVRWDVVLDSSVVKLQKPNVKLFELAELKAGTTGKNILFIENQEKHVHAAKEFGWQAYHYDSSDYEKASKELEEYFTSLY